MGWLGVLAGFVILSYYIVVAGWTMDYTLKSVANFTEPIHEQRRAGGHRVPGRRRWSDMREALVEPSGRSGRPRPEA